MNRLVLRRPRRGTTGGATLISALSAGVLLLVTGCDVAPVEVVTITANGFEPASITVPAGTEVRFVNQVSGRASVTSLDPVSPADPDANLEDADDVQDGEDTDDADGADDRGSADVATITALASGISGSAFDSGPLVQGQAWLLLVDEPGEHLYHSTFHTEVNWVGTISVEGP